MTPAQDTYVALARQIAVKYGVSPALFCSLIEQESNWEPFAIRYEPAFYERYVAPLKLSPTEAHARSFSYGLGQVMGQVAREMGFADRFLTKLCDPATGLDYSCRKLKRCLEQEHNCTEPALLRYNGGSNKDYGREVLNRIGRY